MRAYTDLEQSKKLTDILPLESADGFYAENVIITEPFITYLNGERNIPGYKGAIPCWSLVALLSVIPNYKLSSEHNYHTCAAETSFGKEQVGWYDNPIDACVDMIEKLKEKNLL